MKYSKVENKTKRPVFVDDTNGKAVAIPPMGTLTDVDLDEIQVKNLEDIKMVESEKSTKKAAKKETAEAITLPEEFTAESLAADFKVEQLKAYCKANKITGITGKNELEIAEMIVADHVAKNSNNEE